MFWVSVTGRSRPAMLLPCGRVGDMRILIRVGRGDACQSNPYGKLGKTHRRGDLPSSSASNNVGQSDLL